MSLDAELKKLRAAVAALPPPDGAPPRRHYPHPPQAYAEAWLRCLGALAWQLARGLPLPRAAQAFFVAGEHLVESYEATTPEGRASFDAWDRDRDWGAVLDDHAGYYTRSEGCSPSGAAYAAAVATNRARLAATELYRDDMPDTVVERIAAASLEGEDDPC